MATNIHMSEANYAPLLAKIEIEIVKTDQAAEAEDISLTDSQVRSALHRAGLMARGSQPEIEKETPRDKHLSALITRLAEARREFRIQIVQQDDHLPVPVEMWVNALKTIQDSIRTRTGEPGSRAYLEFARVFVQERLLKIAQPAE